MLNGNRKHHAQTLFSHDSNRDCVLGAFESFARSANLQQLAAFLVREGKFTLSIRVGRGDDTAIGGIQQLDERILDRHSFLINNCARQMSQPNSLGMNYVDLTLTVQHGCYGKKDEQYRRCGDFHKPPVKIFFERYRSAESGMISAMRFPTPSSPANCAAA